MPVCQWLSLLLAIPAAAAIAWLLIKLTVLPVRLWRHFRKRAAIGHWAQVSGPAWLVVGVFVDAILFESIGFPLLPRL